MSGGPASSSTICYSVLQYHADWSLVPWQCRRLLMCSFRGVKQAFEMLVLCVTSAGMHVHWCLATQGSFRG